MREGNVERCGKGVFRVKVFMKKNRGVVGPVRSAAMEGTMMVKTHR